MGISIETVGFCPQYFSDWKVTGSKGDIYQVTIAGAESMPHCEREDGSPCWPFKRNDDCKHIRAVWEHGCLFNPQWKDPGPNDYAQHGIERGAYHVPQTWGEPCPGCGAEMIPVRIAV